MVLRWLFHPPRLRSLPSSLFRFLVDLGISSLFVQKLYSAGIVLSPTTLRYWTSLPALVLVDAIMAVLVQFSAYYIAQYLDALFGAHAYRSTSHLDGGWTALAGYDEDDESQIIGLKHHTNSSPSSPHHSSHSEDRDLEQAHSLHEENITLFSSSPADASPPRPRRGSGASDTTTISSSSSSSAEKLSPKWLSLRTLAYLSASFFTILLSIILYATALLTLAIYQAHGYVFNWEQAFANFGHAKQLAWLASTVYDIFVYVGFFLLLIGIVFTLFRRIVLPRLKIHPYISWSLAAIFLLCSIFLRPPKSAPATNILWDAIVVGLRMLHIIGNKGHHHRFHYDDMSYEYVAPPIYDIGHRFRHVFYIFLESADKLAWPFKAEFCEKRNCPGVDPSFLTPQSRTPFFNNLTQSTLVADNFRTNVAFTIKSHFVSLCGTMSRAQDFATEYQHVLAVPCLPTVLRTLDPSFHAAFFQPSDSTWDHQDAMISDEGFDYKYSKTQMDAQGGFTSTNYFGYADHDAHPKIFEWIDQRLEKNERIFMAFSTTAMHHPFDAPPSYPKQVFTKASGYANAYLNVVRYTDDKLKELFDGLDKRNLLDNSLIVIQGDHGPRIGTDGEIDNGTKDLSLPVPMVIHTGRTRRQLYPQVTNSSWSSIDIVPTVLDALNVNPAIISKYEGLSMLRPAPESRRTLHLCDPGGKGPQLHEGNWKVSKKITGDLCGWNLIKDPLEKYGWCVDNGWQESYEESTKEWKTGESDWTDHDELAKFQAWIKDAGEDLNGRLKENADYWGQNRTAHKPQNQAFMTMLNDRIKNGTVYRPPPPRPHHGGPPPGHPPHGPPPGFDFDGFPPPPPPPGPPGHRPPGPPPPWAGGPPPGPPPPWAHGPPPPGPPPWEGGPPPGPPPHWKDRHRRGYGYDGYLDYYYDDTGVNWFYQNPFNGNPHKFNKKKHNKQHNHQHHHHHQQTAFATFLKKLVGMI